MDLLLLLKAAEEDTRALEYFSANYEHYKDAYNNDYETDGPIQKLSFIPVTNQFREKNKVRPSEVSCDFRVVQHVS